jgi:hypothetical protein
VAYPNCSDISASRGCGTAWDVSQTVSSVWDD